MSKKTTWGEKLGRQPDSHAAIRGKTRLVACSDDELRHKDANIPSIIDN